VYVGVFNLNSFTTEELLELLCMELLLVKSTFCETNLLYAINMHFIRRGFTVAGGPPSVTSMNNGRMAKWMKTFSTI
jgi:hypothetical protein